jgi:hypothetical protein
VRALPASFPEIPRVCAGDERAIFPLKVDPDCVHVSVNVPLNTPLYDPDHVPERPPDAAAAVGVLGAAVLVCTAALVAATLVGGGVVVVDDEPHAAASVASGIAVNITMVRFMSQVLPLL